MAESKKDGDGDGSSSMETISVIARVRPLLDREASSTRQEVVRVAAGGDVTVDFQTPGTRTSAGDRKFRFDRSLGPASSQDDVYKQTKVFTDAALAGFNSTVFAYGQTGTGKTYTMLGVDLWDMAAQGAEGSNQIDEDRKTWGIIPRAVSQIFDHVAKHSETTTFQISCTFIEIYNEKVFDLLRYDESRQLRSGLEIREDKHRGVCIPDAAEVIVSSQDEVLGLLWEGAQNRAVAATDMNEHSSRSHTHEIKRLKSIIREGSKLRGESADPDETRDLEEENLTLLEELSKTKRKLHDEREANRALRQELEQMKRTAVTPSRGAAANVQTLMEKLEVAEQYQSDTSESKALARYQRWLRNLPLAKNGKSFDAGRLTPTDRLTMLEWSVLAQARELRRTQRLFDEETSTVRRQAMYDAVAANSAAVAAAGAALEEDKADERDNRDERDGHGRYADFDHGGGGRDSTGDFGDAGGDAGPAAADDDAQVASYSPYAAGPGDGEANHGLDGRE
eukprot:g3805.t1